jgi:hypothetical protein
MGPVGSRRRAEDGLSRRRRLDSLPPCRKDRHHGLDGGSAPRRSAASRPRLGGSRQSLHVGLCPGPRPRRRPPVGPPVPLPTVVTDRRCLAPVGGAARRRRERRRCWPPSGPSSRCSREALWDEADDLGPDPGPWASFGLAAGHRVSAALDNLAAAGLGPVGECGEKRPVGFLHGRPCQVRNDDSPRRSDRRGTDPGGDAPIPTTSTSGWPARWPPG